MSLWAIPQRLASVIDFQNTLAHGLDVPSGIIQTRFLIVWRFRERKSLLYEMHIPEPFAL